MPESEAPMMKTDKRKAGVLAGPANLAMVYPPDVRAELDAMVEWVNSWPEAGEGKPDWRDFPEDTEYLFSTWGMPKLDAELLDHLPQLRAVFYGAGSVKGFVTDESYARGIRIFSAAAANAVPVAEFTLAEILLGLKQSRQLEARSAEEWKSHSALKHSVPGNFRTRIGLVSYGAIARILRGYLRHFDHEVSVWDPFLSPEEADREGVRLLTREDLFAQSDVVSIHTPLLPATRGLFGAEDVQRMKAGAVLINTARGALFQQEELVAALRERPDVQAVMDVLAPEPPHEDDPIFALPNIRITPHIAGSVGPECGRMGLYMLEALRDVEAGRPTPREVFQSDLAGMA